MHCSGVSGKVCLTQGHVVHRSPWEHWPGYPDTRSRAACWWRPVFGVSGSCCRTWFSKSDNSSSFLWHWELLCHLLCLCQRPKKPKLTDATEEGIKDVLHPCSLPHCCHASSTQQQQPGSPAGAPVTQSSPPPRPGAVWLPAPGPQALPVPMKCSESVFPERISPYSVTLCCLHGTDLSGISFTVQCGDVPSKTQRVNTV